MLIIPEHQLSAINPVQTNAYVNLARLYLAQGKVAETEAMYVQGAEKNPDSALTSPSMRSISSPGARTL